MRPLKILRQFALTACCFWMFAPSSYAITHGPNYTPVEAAFPQASAASITDGSLATENAKPSTGQQQVEKWFGTLKSASEAYNSGGSAAAERMLIDTGCQKLVNAAKDSSSDSVMATDDSLSFLPAGIRSVLGSKTRQVGQNLSSSLCMALQGQKSQSLDLNKEVQLAARGEAFPMLVAAGQNAATWMGIPFLNHLEIELGGTGGDLIGSITSVQPLWKDLDDKHHVFAQVSWYNAADDKNNLGFQKEYDTVNAGLAYRYLTDDKNYLYGANIFFDRAPEKGYNRMSFGADVRTSQLALSANKYWPVSDWTAVDAYYEEKAAGGLDAELRGQIPELPSWTASFKAFEWDSQEKGEDLYGLTGAVEYSPIPALAMRLGITDDTQDEPQVEALVRFAWQFDKPTDMQIKPRTELAPVSSYIYSKVQRENLIRVKQQRREESKLTVIQSIGSNNAVEAGGAHSLSVGQSLLMPVTITVANTAGAIGRLSFSDGSILTLAQNSQASVQPNRITLVYGTLQYVNNGAVQTVVVPGGTVTLHGTDIDVVSSGGASSSVRVRDGSVDFVGSVAGAATLAVEQAAQSIGGNVGAIAPNSGAYIAHTDAISTEIDRIASVQTGTKVAPYPYEAPRIVSNVMSVGGTIVFGQRFNDPVVVSGGTPRLAFTINGNTRYATYVSGSGTNDLQFSYTNVMADISALSLVVNSFDKNGASITGNGKEAVTTIADATLSVAGTGDITAPSGYSVSFTSGPVNIATVAAVAFDILAAEVGSTYSYTISDGVTTIGPVTGTIGAATHSIAGVDLSSLADGTLTLLVTLADSSANTGASASTTITKDVVSPTIVSVVPPADEEFEP